MAASTQKYQIQNIDFETLANEYGTPLYIYDAEKIISQLKFLQTAFSDHELRIKYAIKALSNIAILKLLKQYGSGVDAVSINEVKLALLAGYSPDDILYTPNCVDMAEMSEAVNLGVNVNIDNLSLLKKFGEKYKNTYPCCVRLNPHIQAGGHYKISTGHGNSKFGISVFQLSDLLNVASRHRLNIVGLHIHTGSEISDTDVYLKISELLYGIAQEFPSLKFLDFGGGFKVAYKPDDYATNILDLGLKLNESLRAFCQTYGRKLELWVEPGKFLVSEAGYLLAKTTVVKSTPAQTFVGINTGLNHLIRPMMYDAYHDIVNISNPSGDKKLYTVVGNICETDTFGTDRRLNEVREGDLLLIKNAGAYGYSMASQFNARLRPAEVLIQHGESKLIRHRDVFEDLLRGQVY